jgi:hypothetical protein
MLGSYVSFHHKMDFQSLTHFIDRSEAYISCTVILHSIVQKQLHGFLNSDWLDDFDSRKSMSVTLGILWS